MARGAGVRLPSPGDCFRGPFAELNDEDARQCQERKRTQRYEPRLDRMDYHLR
jgi:hypothetical protein